MRNIPIVQSQYAPPPIRERFIRRGQLNRKLSAISKHTLTLLHAGAGYGKSTALALYLHDTNIKACWYSISATDDDILPFFTKIVESVRMHYPSFGESIHQKYQDLGHYVDGEQIYSLASAFINELMDLKEEITIILDDYHHVNGSYEIEKWTLFLLEHAPANVHIVLSSRNKPKWAILPKLKVRGDLIEISQEDLLLSANEMYFVLEDVLKIELNDEKVEKIYELTEGWAIAFNMLMQQIVDESSIEEIFSNRQTSMEDLFEYLASEVLSKQSLIIQQFLLQSSVMDVLIPKACDHVLQINGSENILHGLLEQNLFIAEGEETYFRYHALFKAFLENRLLKNYPSEYKSLHKKAAQYYERHEDIESALYHYKKIAQYPKMASLLQDYGLTMLQSGRLQSLYDLITTIPDEFKQIYPVLYFYQGEIERYRSQYDKAEKNFDRIISLIPGYDQENYNLIGLAFEGKAKIYLDTIQPDQAERFVKQAIYMREKANAPKEEMAQLYQLLAENLLNLGQAKKAEAWFDRANSLNIPIDDGNLEARILLRTGRLAKAQEVLLRRKETSSTTNTKHLPQSHRETDLLLSIIEAFMGNAEESKKLASDGIQLGLTTQSPFVEACGWMRMGHAVQLLERYDSKLAEQCYETSLDMMETINISRGKAEPYMGLSILLGKNLEYERAVEAANRGLVETEKVKDKWLSALIKLGLLMTEVYNHHYDRAKVILDDVREDFVSCGDRYGIMVTNFWKAYLAHKEENDPVFLEEMTQFIDAIHTDSYEFFLKKQTVFGPMDLQNIAPLLFKAKRLGIKPQLVSRYMNELQLDVDSSNHPGYTLTIEALGYLRVGLGSKYLEERDWQRGKAKELFELFVTNRNKLLSKEEILASLWPEQDLEASNKNFKVTFNALLRALEPNRKAREESYFILRKGSYYGLNPDSGYVLDIDNFESWTSKAIEEKEDKQAKELLEKVIKLYRGSYLEDLRFASWCQSERERLELLFLRGAEKLAQINVRLQDYHACIQLCERIIAINHTWEEAYRLLMFSYYQLNNRPQAIRWYEKCCEVLEEELGVEPMTPTREMYHVIIESEEVDRYLY
ncbi:BTAD domain-containing putative transcriptional regulator [Ornithinibacillus scapharcae]|uniref:BTAD domain-containing putative transcriptional regulator n=1 Tax=Ornithinibacillus scapharcae TaxID=1147159 RepID=UPI000225BF1A|nr:BTAD domain-containing putative transcriptional regulator [Ornithinibacillus scapharcae]